MKYTIEEYQSFKYLLEYFVAHLEYIASGFSNTSLGYDKYIKPLVNKNAFKSSGQGYKGQTIQTQVGMWDQYSNGQICINIYGANYQSRGTYLNWKGTGYNITADWKGTHIESLYLLDYDPDSGGRLPQNISFTLSELGLFDEQAPNENLYSFFEKYNAMIESYKTEQHLEMNKYINLLKTNKNLILTGAPGTGKTFMAKEIVKAMGCVDEEIGFVQFHPSYDYTDFVEGLRPIKDDNGNVGVERKDGVFKEFCKSAMFLGNNNPVSAEHAINVNAIYSFDVVYQSVVNDIKSGKLNTYQTAYKTQKLGVKDNRIVFRADSNHPRTESEKNLKLMYDYFVEHNIYDLSHYDKDAYWTLISKLTHNQTVTIDYMEYGWILQELLNRVSKAKDREENKKRNVSLLHPDVYQSDDVLDTLGKLEDERKNSDEHPCVFIIDEINRGEISKIFGELFFSIDPGYRGEAGKVQTQYQNMVEDGDVFKDGFYVPENVYIIGTMNDIDRSVESMDFAMRRRFAWAEVSAEESMQMLDSMPNEEALKNRMRNLNEAILKTNGLGKAYQIGAAYFKKYEKYNSFEALWQYHLEGLLAEYLRGSTNAEKELAELKKAYEDESPKDVAANNNQG